MRKSYFEMSKIERVIWKIRHSFPRRFNEFCFKVQIPYWKLLFKYKYHSNYREAELGEWKRYHKRHFGKELNVRSKRKVH